MRRWLWIGLLIFIFLSLILWGLAQFNSINFLPIRVVEVYTDAVPVEQSQLKQQIAPLTQAGFFNVNLPSIQAAIQQLPWVSSAEIKRVWPNRLLVFIVDQNIIGRWNQNDLINSYGEILPFNSSVDVVALPLFQGPDDKSIKMLDYYQKINLLLVSLNLKISEILLDEGGYWQLTLNNGIKIQLGNEHILTRLRHFVKVYNIILQKHTLPPKEVDLRYKEGMAIKW